MFDKPTETRARNSQRAGSGFPQTCGAGKPRTQQGVKHCEQIAGENLLGKRAPVSSGSFLLWRAAHQASWFCLICPISVRRNLLALFRGLEHCRQAMSICHAPQKSFPHSRRA